MSGRCRSYMSKRDRACDSCRVKKAACRIDRLPPCYLCTIHGKECTFLHPTSRSRRPFPGPVDTQSAGQAERSSRSKLPDEVPQLDESVPYDMLTLADSNEIDHLIHSGRGGSEFLFEGPEGSISNSLGAGLWPTGFSPGSFAYPSPDMQVAGSLDDAVDLHTTSSPLIHPGDMGSNCIDTNDAATPHLLGSSGDMDPLLLNRYKYNGSGTFHFKNLSIQSMTTGSNPTQFLLSQPSIFATSREENGRNKDSADELRQELETLIPADIGLLLISLFQRIILPDYPILGPQDQLSPTTSPPYLLASIYITIAHFIKFDERLCIDLAYDKPSVSSLCGIINKALQYEIHAPKLSLVQTMLLLAIRPYPDPIVLDSGLKWYQFTTLIACAHSLGLHLDPKSWQISAWQISRRRFLSYCIYSVDKWLALSLGRPPLLRDDNWLVTTIKQEDRLASGLDPMTWLRIMKRAELDSLLDRVLAQLYSLRAVNTLCTDYERTLALAGPLLDDLLSWEPPVLVPSTEFTSLHRGRPIGLHKTVEMSYHYIHISITKAILRPFLHVDTVEQSNNPAYIMAREQARLRARACISAAADFTHDLKPDDLETLWPAWSATAFSCICFQILTMATSSLDANEAAEWVSCLHKVRRDMRLKADALPFLRLGLLRIDSIFWKGIENVLHMEEHVREAFTIGLSTSLSLGSTGSTNRKG